MANPTLIDLTIAVDELHVLEPGDDRAQPREALVARARGGEGGREVELDDLDAERPRRRDAPVRRARIDIDDRPALLADGLEAAPQPFAFVAADRDDSERGKVGVDEGSLSRVTPCAG